LKPKQVIPVPAPTAPWTTGPSVADGQRRHGIGLGHGQRLNVVQGAIVAFHHHRIDSGCAAPDAGVRGNGGPDQRIGTAPDAKGIGQQDRGFQRAQFLHLHQTGAFAEPVDHLDRRRHLVGEQVAGVRDHSRYPGGQAPAQPRAMPDRNPGDIGDGVQRPRRHHTASKPPVPHQPQPGHTRRSITVDPVMPNNRAISHNR
jgi:hypothetical protein